MQQLDDHKIEEALKKLQALDVSASSILRAKNILMANVRESEALRLPTKQWKFFHLLIPKARLKYKYMVLALIVAIILGGGGTVAAAQNDLPGDTLYGVKLAAEQFTGKLIIRGDEAKVNFAAKLAERRAHELAAVKVRANASAKAQGNAETQTAPDAAARLEKAAENLSDHIARTKDRVSKLKAHDTKGTLNASAVLEAKVEIMEEVLSAVKAAETKVELRTQLDAVRQKAKELRADVKEAHESALKSESVKQKFEVAARGRVQAAENKLAALTAKRERVLAEAQKDSNFSEEAFNAYDVHYQTAVRLVAEAKVALDGGKWEDAWRNADAAFKAMVHFGSHPVILDKQLLKPVTPADVEIQEVRTGEKLGPPLTNEQKVKIREEAAAGVEAKRLEILNETANRRANASTGVEIEVEATVDSN